MNITIAFKYATPYRYCRYFGIGAELVRRGHKVRIYASVSNSVVPHEVPKIRFLYRTIFYNGVEVVWFNGPKIKKNGLLRAFTWFLFEFQVILHQLFVAPQGVDILVSSSPSIFSVISGSFISSYRKAKWFFEVRDVWPASLTQPGGLSKQHPVIKIMEQCENYAYKRSNVVIGTMPNLKQRVDEVTKRDSNNVYHLAQGVDFDLFGKDAESLEKEYIKRHLPKDKFIVAYTGTLNLNNPIDTLLEVARECHSKYSELFFVILGSGYRKNYLMEKYGELDNVSFPPIIKKSQMSSFLREVDIGYDSFSEDVGKYGMSRNKWIDYMYNECVILCSSDGFKGTLSEAKCGFYLPYDDVKSLMTKIIELSNMPSWQLMQIKSNGRKYVSINNSYRHLADKFLEITEEAEYAKANN